MDTYCDVSFADDYHSERGNEEWEDVDAEDKETALLVATEYMDNNYIWQGEKVEDDQDMLWPREDVTDFQGQEVTEEEIPEAIKKACAELAYINETEQELESIGGVEATTIRAGKLSVSSETPQEKELTRKVDKILRGYYEPSNLRLRRK